MTQHDQILRMRHMLDHAKEAVGLLAGKEKADLYRSKDLTPTPDHRPFQ